jgi:acetyl esterase/lipase
MSDPAPVPGYAFDPELADLAAVSVHPPPTDAAEARRQMAEMMATMRIEVDVTGLAIEDVVVPGPPGAPDVTVRVYTPKPRTADQLPAVLHIHGGAFALGSIESESAGAVRLAREVGAVVVSVEYRLAPEDPFPAGLEDCYAALTWLHDDATGLGVDPARVAICGSSAGGGLAAALALLARDRNGPPICFQYLGIPELDDRLDTPSMRRFHDTPMFSRPAAERSWDWYLGDGRRGGADVSPYAAPARATDVSGLPPAYVSAMEFDPLRDEGILYALALLAAGVAVELHVFPGTFHGSVVAEHAAVTQREKAEQIVVLRRALGVDAS